MNNYWLALSEKIVEKEVLLVKNGPDTRRWYDEMPLILSIIFPIRKQPLNALEFGPKVGIAHHLRYTRLGIEAVLKMPKKYYRFEYYVLKDKVNQPADPFWVVLFKS